MEWQEHSGLPRIPGAAGFLGCRVAGLVDGGDHVVVLGAVMTADSTAGEPLTYRNREFGTHTRLEEAP
ncbi:flavin reductase [Streptomyces sp. NPDC005820]|uniref:flavin reductase n=1 Tax=Streptomyces sp. NPDC005820 TaxID=3157069 RepID=UPI0033C2FD41